MKWFNRIFRKAYYEAPRWGERLPGDNPSGWDWTVIQALDYTNQNNVSLLTDDECRKYDGDAFLSWSPSGQENPVPMLIITKRGSPEPVHSEEVEGRDRIIRLKQVALGLLQGQNTWDVSPGDFDQLFNP